MTTLITILGRALLAAFALVVTYGALIALLAPCRHPDTLGALAWEARAIAARVTGEPCPPAFDECSAPDSGTYEQHDDEEG
jgi:hypothetical protein